MQVLILLLALILHPAPSPGQTQKQQSIFFPTPLIENAKANCARYAWAAKMRKSVLDDAAPWMKMADQELWALQFGPNITRSHMVWSSGYCPSCRRPVPMYDWEIDAFARPWKARCPRCGELFPKNDFARFHRSGLDEHGVFDPQRADRRLLFNSGHPDPADPLHKFGVDDGEGYIEGDKRWRFIGAYLLYGQYDQLIERGISTLATAYTLTGDRLYAHKAANHRALGVQDATGFIWLWIGHHDEYKRIIKKQG